MHPLPSCTQCWKDLNPNNSKDFDNLGPMCEECFTKLNAARENEYILQDSRQYIGNCMYFWALNGQGYTCHLNNVQIYTKEEAFKQHRSRSSDIPIRLYDARKAATLQVDVQLYRQVAPLPPRNP